STGPKNTEEINNFFISNNILDKAYSKDTLRMDLNCLKSYGIKISRASKNDGRYVLLSSPFMLKITKKEIKAISKLYNMNIEQLTVPQLITYHRLFNKLTDFTEPAEYKELIKGISILKNLNIDLLEELNKDCKNKNLILIKYQSPRSSEREIKIKTDYIGFRSNKLYLFGFDTEHKKHVFLNISRIKEILLRFLDKDIPEAPLTTVKFRLKNFENYTLENTEIITDKNENEATIMGQYYNDFIAIQRMMYFAEDCTVLEPQEIVDKIIEKLLNMRKHYD
ncbi:WYL domain-containing protein, partial [bacterium]|nr:WYL domain-containing protein [bacterium]